MRRAAALKADPAVLERYLGVSGAAAHQRTGIHFA
jgi:hypothetical protein